MVAGINSSHEYYFWLELVDKLLWSGGWLNHEACYGRVYNARNVEFIIARTQVQLHFTLVTAAVGVFEDERVGVWCRATSDRKLQWDSTTAR